MLTSVNTNRQSNWDDWQTTAPTTGLRRVSRIYSDNLNCGTFSLHFQDIKELRPTSIMCRLGKAERPHNAFDIQIFVNNYAVTLNQIKRSFVMEIFAFVCYVSMNTSKGFDRLTTVHATPVSFAQPLFENGAVSLVPFDKV